MKEIMTEVLAEELGQHIGETVQIHGSIYKIRRMSGFSFVLLRTRRSVVQCIYSGETADFSQEELEEEACVVFEAYVKAEERSRTGYELELRHMTVLSRPVAEPPVVIHNKQIEASLETKLDYRPITLRNERERAVFKLQAGILEGFRTFFKQEEFTEIHSPKLVFAGAEGGANIFKLDYFGREAYLAQSPQFYKQMMVGVFERVYEIGPVFRAEKHDTSRHLNEYTSVDLEMGYIKSYTELMDLETRLLKEACAHLAAEYEKELALLGVTLPVIGEIPRIPFQKAKELVAEEYKREIVDNLDFEPEEERLLCELVKERYGSEFVFVTEYPEAKRPFYAKELENKTTASFDLLFRGLEITTGGQRIHSYEEQLEKLNRRGMDPEKFESYLLMHKYGMPPHGGLGLGLERLTSRLLGQENVRMATLFPRDINRLTP